MNDFAGELIEKHLNGALKSEETARLGRMLAENPALADRFMEAVRMDTGLRHAMKEQEREPLFVRMLENMQKNLPPPGRRKRVRAAVEKHAAAVLVLWRPLTAAAAGLAVLGGGAWLAFHPRDPGVAQQGEYAGATPKVERNVFTGSGASGFMDTAPEKMDAAAVRRRLRGFFVPSVRVRNVPVSEALAALEEQWKSLPHRRGPESAAEVAFVIADSVRKLWTDAAEEPRVTLEMPGVSLLTHLELLAAQAGLKAGVSEKGVTLERDLRASAEDANEVKTWTLTMAKPTVELLAGRMKRDVAVSAGAEKRVTLEVIREFTHTDNEVPGTEIMPNADPAPEVSIASKFVEVAQASAAPSPDGSYEIDLNIAPEVVEFEGFIDYGKPLRQGEEILLTESKIEQPVFSTIRADPPPATPEDAMRSQIATHKVQVERLRDLSGQQLVDEVIAQGAEDTTIQTFQEHYHTARKEYDQLIGEGYGESHPRLAGLKNAIGETSKILETAAEQYRNTLQFNINNIEAALQEVSRMEAASNNIDLTADQQGFDFEQLRRYGTTDAPGLVMENLLNAHSGAGLAYNPETETLVLTGDRQKLQAAQKAAGAVEECATAGAAVEVRFVEWEDAPPVLSGNAPELLHKAPRFLNPTQEIYRLTGTAGPDGESIERNEKGNTAMVRFALNAPPVGLKRFYDRNTGDGKATDALEWKLQCDRGGERMSLKVTTQGDGGAGKINREEHVDLFPDQWTSINIKKGEWQENFGVRVFLRVKPAAIRE